MCRFVLVLILASSLPISGCIEVVVDPPHDGGTDGDVQPTDGDTDETSDLWCAAQWPYATETTAGTTTEPLFVRLRVRGVTPTDGDDPGLRVELGYGPPEAHPSETPWSWTAAEHNPLCDTCPSDQDEFMGTVTPSSAGDFRWGGRIRYGDGGFVYCDRGDDGRSGSDDGWRDDDAPRLDVRREQRLRVVSLNLRCLLDDWDLRRPLVVDALAEIDPDLIGFQEVCAERSDDGRDNLRELLDALSERTDRSYSVSRAATHLSWDTYDEGLALATPHRLDEPHDVDLPPGAFPRKMLLATIQTPLGAVAFATTHLDHLSPEARAEQIRALRRALDELVDPATPIVLTGDFNEEPDGGSVHSTLSGAGMTDLWVSLRPGEPGLTFPADRPEIRIDYIWLRPGSPAPLLEPASIERILDVEAGGVTGSDHLGLLGEIRVFHQE